MTMKENNQENNIRKHLQQLAKSEEASLKKAVAQELLSKEYGYAGHYFYDILGVTIHNEPFILIRDKKKAHAFYKEHQKEIDEINSELKTTLGKEFKPDPEQRNPNHDHYQQAIVYAFDRVSGHILLDIEKELYMEELEQHKKKVLRSRTTNDK